MQSLIRLSRLYRFRLYRPRFPPYAPMLGLFVSAAGLPLSAQAQTAQAQARPEPTDPIADVTIPDLHGANEAQVRAAWEKLQDQLRITEATLPAAVIPLYGQFLDQGGARYPDVAIEVVSHVGKLYLVDLRDFDKAIEAYDWGLANYAQHPDAFRLQSERLEALKAQAQQEHTKAGMEEAPAVGVTLPSLGAMVPQAVVPTLQGMVVGVVSPEPVRAEGAAAVGPLKLPALGIDPATTAVPFGGVASSPLVVAPVAFTPPSLVPATRTGNYLGWRAGPGRCVTALARQKNGRLWVATEDSGVWSCDESAPALTRWRQFRSGDGLGDDSAYALAVDQQDRVWVGTLNHGVSVWNGQSWKNYGVLDGPLGERVFDIAVCPTDGDVWLATNAGLTRYSQSLDTWSYITKAEGLFSDQVQALAFDKQGNMVVGTQCDGVALASAAKGYKDWRVIRGAEQMPTTPTGSGLPSNLINDVMVAKNGTIYVATTTGLAWSKDQGLNWSYVRGRDYAAKVNGRYGGVPVGWKQEAGAILAEDYVTCLAEDEKGFLWLGHWQLGSEVLAVENEHVTGLKSVAADEKNGFVRSILTSAGDVPLLARYDEGLAKQSLNTKSELALDSGVHGLSPNKVADSTTAAPFPSSLNPPTARELQSLLKEIESVAQEAPESNLPVIRLADDWRTQGNWLGRYGRYWSCLCAFSSPKNYVWGAGEIPVRYMLGIGPKRQSDSLRYWVHWLSTDNPRVLEMPPIYADSRVKKGLAIEGRLRRQSEVDDHGEAYPLSQEGPDIYVSLSIPPGTYTLSFYNHNKDGESGMNRMRDYDISLRSRPTNTPIEAIDGFDQWPELAHSRQLDFRGGVYQKFMLRGPQELTVKFCRNNSYNTIIAGIFLDEINEEPSPYFQGSKVQSIGFGAPALTNRTLESEAINDLWGALEEAKKSKPRWWATSSRRYYAVLARSQRQPSPNKSVDTSNTSTVFSKEIGSGFYNLNMFASWEETQHQRHLTTARDIEKSLTWDGKLWDERGQGKQLINNFLTAPKATK